VYLVDISLKTNSDNIILYWNYETTPGTGWRESTFGALVLGKLDDGNLTYVGCVGTGFNDQEIADLYADMKSATLFVSPFGRVTSEVPRDVVWVKPQIKVKVRFLEYTNFGILRFPAYTGRVK